MGPNHIPAWNFERDFFSSCFGFRSVFCRKPPQFSATFRAQQNARKNPPKHPQKRAKPPQKNANTTRKNKTTGKTKKKQNDKNKVVKGTSRIYLHGPFGLDELGRPLGQLVFSLLASVGDLIYEQFFNRFWGPTLNPKP